jgi:hypothetical protein
VLEKEKENKSTEVKEFVKKNWPWIVGAGLTTAGVAVFLTVRYFKDKEKGKIMVDMGRLDRLEQLEREALYKMADAPKLIETGRGIASEMGSKEVVEVVAALGLAVPDEEVSLALKVVEVVAKDTL